MSAFFIRAYVRAEKLDEAESFLNSVLSSNPNSAEAYVLLANLSSRKSKRELAEKNYKLAIEKQPDNPVGYRGLANFYNQKCAPYLESTNFLGFVLNKAEGQTEHYY